MKNKKGILKILFYLIVVLSIILGVVFLVGIFKDKKIKAFNNEVESAACKMAKDYNYTKEICEAFPHLCKINFNKLVEGELIDREKKNPNNHKAIKDDTKSYVEILWKDDEMKCIYKEG